MSMRALLCRGGFAPDVSALVAEIDMDDVAQAIWVALRAGHVVRSADRAVGAGKIGIELVS